MGQALLFSPELEESIQAEEAKGSYTAERALVKRPGLKDAVISLRAAGEGYLSIAKKLNCHHMVASAIAAMFPENVDMERAKRVSRLRSAADKMVELIDTEPWSVPANMRALAASQLYDKAELLDGRATQRIERTERIDIYAGWDEVVEKMLEPGGVLEIAGPAIGLVDENVLAISAPAGGSAQVGQDTEVDQAIAGDADIDAESADSSISNSEHSDGVTTLETNRATESSVAADLEETPGRRDQGGAGGSATDRGAISPIHTKTQNFSGNGSSSPSPLP